MKTSPAAISLVSDKYRTALLLVLIVAGLAGNYFKFPVFFSIDFLFGSIFAMLALQFFGLGRGILAAAIIAGYTYFLWNHPYAIIIMTAEVATVGLLMRRRKIGMVLADTLFWLVIGMPLVYLFYHVAMEIQSSSTYIIMTKQAVNCIANALIARLIFTAYALRSRALLTSYHEIVYNLLAFFVLCPALISLAVESRKHFADTDLEIRSALKHDSGGLTLRLETWVRNREAAIVNLASLASSGSSQQMQSYLELIKKADVNLKYIGLQDREALTIAIFPLVDELGQKNIGKSFADRSYIRTLKQTLKPMLSEVVIGKFGNPKPTVAMLAPVIIGENYGGYIFGVLGLEQLQQCLDKSADENDLLYTLIDKNSNVIMTNRSDQMVMTPFVRANGTLKPLDKAISQWLPIQGANSTPTEKWEKSYYVAETAIGALSEWKLILEQPVAPFQKKLYDDYRSKLILLFVILLGALALAELLSCKIVVSLGKLRTLSLDLPARVGTDDKEIVWPESGIIEANYLICNFRKMAASLTEKFKEVRQLNALLEQRVEERTSELQLSRDEWKHTFDSMPDMVTILDLNHHILHANKAMVAVFDPHRGGCQLDKPCYKLVHDLDAPPTWCPYSLLMLDGFEHQQEIFDPRLNKHLFVTVTPIRNSDGNLIGSIHVARDISARVSIEDELATLAQEVDRRNRFVESVVTSLQSGIIVVDPDLRIKMVNSYVAGLCGIAEEQFVGKKLADLSPELYEAFQNGNSADEQLINFCHIKIHVGYNVCKLTDNEGNVVDHIINFKDLTEVVKIRKELRQKERLSAMGEVVARVAHEMRNPLFGMTAAAQILEMELKLEANQQELMDSLLKESRRLNNLVEELLATTRETRISKKRVNLVDVLEVSLKAVEAMLTEKMVSLCRSYEGEVWLSADFEKLEQVVINLVKNAAEASRSGGYIAVEVVTNDDYVSVIVSDNGQGITVESIDKIFDVFYTTKKNGTGMGLSICRAIVEAHGGSLTASNNVDGGARFVMELPGGESET